MKRTNIKVLVALSAALAAAFAICGCMDRTEAPGPGAGNAVQNTADENVSGDDNSLQTVSHENVSDDAPESGTEAPDASAETTSAAEDDDRSDAGSANMPEYADEAEVKEAICKIYKERFSCGTVTVGNYIGEFNGVRAVMIYEDGKKYTQAKWSETVDGVVFNYKDGNRILIFDGSSFYTLQEAFDKRLVNHDDLVSMASRHNAQEYFAETDR